MQAVVVQREAEGGLAITEVEEPTPLSQEVIVEVHTISINRGEVRAAANKPDGARMGWDLAGVVVQPAADGSGPRRGQRVIGFSRRQDAWAQRVAVPSRDVGVLPDDAPFNAAVTLPVAGLTALHGVEANGSLLGRRVAVTGCTGGVGMFAVQLACQAGAQVVATVRRPEQVEYARALGAASVLVTQEGEGLEEQGPFHLTHDGVGGVLLQNLLTNLAADGVAFSFGVTGGATISLPIPTLMGKGRAKLYGYNLYAHSAIYPARTDLERLSVLLAAGQLAPRIGREAVWTEIGELAKAFLARTFQGKGVLHLKR